jgi:hypothetical protein
MEAFVVKLIRTALVPVLLLVLAAGSQAGQGTKGKQTAGTKGVVTSVDTAARSFVFRAGKKKDPNAKEVTVQFTDQTKFVRLTEAGTADAKAEDLAVKKHVRVVYGTKGDKNVATAVTIVDLPKKTKK